MKQYQEVQQHQEDQEVLLQLKKVLVVQEQKLQEDQEVQRH